jgi:protocatechuate 3,4-dioxygenase beta subunit
MKIIFFLLLLLAIVIGAGQYIRTNPLKFNFATVPSRDQTNPTVQPIDCSKTPIQSVTEGPYYKEGSPMRTNIRENHPTGTSIAIKGRVMDTNCNPITAAWIDFWQADENGNYDNTGFNLRGHQYTDNRGQYSLQTVIPGEYPGRTPHIHVELRLYEGGPVTTTQLFIPNVEKNQSDTLYNESLLINIKDGPNGQEGTYDFIISTQ